MIVKRKNGHGHLLVVFATVNMKSPCCIIMGNEEEGISPEYIKLSDCKAKLPMKGSIGSLNVSVACGVILYEALKQRN